MRGTRAHLPVHTPECNGTRECSYALARRLQGTGGASGVATAWTTTHVVYLLHAAGVLEHAVSVPRSQRDTRLRANDPARTSGSRAPIKVGTSITLHLITI